MWCSGIYVSWNDHFFILKVEPEAYYIIDTLGERLYEGCDQVYILKFDRETTICRVSNETPSSDGKPSADLKNVAMSDSKNGQAQHNNNTKETSVTEQLVVKPEVSGNEEEKEVVCRGNESCKEYMKSFLAAIPLRELQVDIKKGLMDSTPLHHRLQIEFHYTDFLQQAPAPQEPGAAAQTLAYTEFLQQTPTPQEPGAAAQTLACTEFLQQTTEPQGPKAAEPTMALAAAEPTMALAAAEVAS